MQYHKIHNSDTEVIARINGRELAHKVAEVADVMRPEDGPHSVQNPSESAGWDPSDGAGYMPTEER